MQVGLNFSYFLHDYGEKGRLKNYPEQLDYGWRVQCKGRKTQERGGKHRPTSHPFILIAQCMYNRLVGLNLSYLLLNYGVKDRPKDYPEQLDYSWRVQCKNRET